MDSYYNTTHVTGDELAQYRQVSQAQESAIAVFFRRHPGECFAPSMVKARILPSAEITSVRRAMSDLTSEGVLEKLRQVRLGPKGRPEHLWRLKVNWVGTGCCEL